MTDPLLLLPGMMCDARLFAPQIEALSSQATIHLAALTEHDSIAALARQVLADAPPRFAMAGLSMGGIVAMEVIRQAPERVSKLALLDTNPLAESPKRQQLRMPQIERVRAGGLMEVMRDELKPNYLVDSPEKPDILDLCMNMALVLGADVFERQSLALKNRPDQRDHLRRIKVPTLVLCGAEDHLCPPERHQLIQQLIPGARLEIIDKAGHLTTLEQAAATTAALQHWMENT